MPFQDDNVEPSIIHGLCFNISGCLKLEFFPQPKNEHSAQIRGFSRKSLSYRHPDSADNDAKFRVKKK